jgi:hypothetical protein
LQQEIYHEGAKVAKRRKDRADLNCFAILRDLCGFAVNLLYA